jgi:hypothetical protein
MVEATYKGLVGEEIFLMFVSYSLYFIVLFHYSLFI